MVKVNSPPDGSDIKPGQAAAALTATRVSTTRTFMLKQVLLLLHCRRLIYSEGPGELQLGETGGEGMIVSDLAFYS